MQIIARGSEMVRDLEQALGGTPPKAAVDKSRRELQRVTAARFKAQKRSREEMARLVEPKRSLMFSHIAKDNPKLKKSIEDMKAVWERWSKLKIKAPKAEKFEPHFAVGSNFWLKAPPTTLRRQCRHHLTGKRTQARRRAPTTWGRYRSVLAELAQGRWLLAWVYGFLL